MSERFNSHAAFEAPFAARLPGLIGRQQYIDTIRAAIGNTTRRSHILYFVGPGGVGKTCLLEEIVTVQVAHAALPCRSTSIIDLYHAEYHSPEGLRNGIATGLDPENRYFQQYRSLRLELDRMLSYGIFGAELSEMRSRLDSVFLHEYELLAGLERLVLCFDTLELIQYESEIVQEICQIQDVDMEIKHWFLKQVSRFPNTVVLFAGRPRPRLQIDFEREFRAAGCRYEAFELAGFTEGEARTYIESQRAQRPSLSQALTPEVEARLVQTAPIRPIHLTLLLDLAQAGDSLSEVFPVAEDDIAVASPTAPPTNNEAVSHRLFERLLDQWLPEPFHEMIYFLLRARKGLDADLLSALAGPSWPAEEIRGNLARMRDLALVKVRPGTDRLFLHDEIYDLCDLYFKDEPRYREGYDSIARYYRQRLANAVSPREREDLMVEQLYYEFQVDAHHAFYCCYVQWNEDAILSNAADFDMRLRDEMLRFLERYADPDSPFFARRVAERIDRAAIDRDSAVRWVKRYLTRSEYAKAGQVAENVRASTHPAFEWDRVKDPLYNARWSEVTAKLRVFAGAAESETTQLLIDAVRLLESEQRVDACLARWQARILGRAYNDLGYLYRVHGHYGRAAEAYKRALPLFQQADIQDELAFTHNNLAFLLAQLARVTLALHHVEQALAIRKRISEQYIGRTGPLAISHNTRGLIHTYQEHPMWGEQECREALRMYEEVKDNRGIGLCCIGVGFALRKRGDQWKLGVYTDEESKRHFQQAVVFFERAVNIFSTQVSEPLRLWEAYNELGSLYCDWGWLRHRTASKAEAAIEQYDLAIKWQEQALAVARKFGLRFQIADSYDDLAQAYSDQSFLLAGVGQHDLAKASRKQAEDYLDQVLAMIPPAFLLAQGQGFSQPPEEGEAYLLALGKVYYWRGTWAFRDVETRLVAASEQKDRLEYATRQFIVSAIYLRRYWPKSFAFEQTLNRFGRFLSRQTTGITPEWAHAQVRAILEEYRSDPKVVEDLWVVEEVIGEALGL